jgi:hypothetical protein
MATAIFIGPSLLLLDRLPVGIELRRPQPGQAWIKVARFSPPRSVSRPRFSTSACRASSSIAGIFSCAWLHQLCLSLPFAYEYFYPATILIGHVQGAALAWGFLWQWAWIGFFYMLSGICWKRGLHQYTAVGG